jgi:hypothetical protein
MAIRKPFKILIGMLTARIIILPLLNQFLLSVAPSVSFLDGRLNGSSLTINMAVGNISMFRLICSIILYLGMLIFFIIHNNIYISRRSGLPELYQELGSLYSRYLEC